MLRGIIYIASIVFQLAGAVILIAHYMGSNIDKYVSLELEKEHNNDLGDIDEKKKEISRDDFEQLAQQLYYNRMAFIYIAVGYIASPFAEEYWSDCWEVIMIIVFTTLLFEMTVYIIDKRIKKELMCEHDNFVIMQELELEREEMNLYERLINKDESIALVGLGYVGMPIAVAFAKKGLNVIGFDLNKEKIELYKSGIDPTKEVGDEEISKTSVKFTSDEKELQNAKFIIVAVPTPVNTDHTPDLTPVIGASEIVGRNLTKGTIVVYESTVYPGCTEDVCIPILEKQSGMKCGEDFKVGYSPERINPGDKVHRLENIHKIVSGMDKESLETIKAVYDIVIEVGTYPVSNLRTAEAVKVVENSQRDINIAFMNELAMVFDRMDIDTNEVVDGMNTKWNALGFRPGLVGGHCIGVDPYYFTHEAEKLGYHSQIILNGRIVNDSMGAYIADAAVRKMIEAGQAPKKSKVVILGLTFKENCPDTRNSKVEDIIRQLNKYGIVPEVVDPWADEEDAMREYGVTLLKLSDISDADCLIVAVAHTQFKEMSLTDIGSFYRDVPSGEKVLIDVKGLFDVEKLRESGMTWWRL